MRDPIVDMYLSLARRLIALNKKEMKICVWMVAVEVVDRKEALKEVKKSAESDGKNVLRRTLCFSSKEMGGKKR